MSIPHIPGKHAGKAVIEPATVIRERKAAGLHCSAPVPAGAIICYDSALWQWVGTLPGRVACDGWLKGAYLLPRGDRWILAMKAAGWGSPTAVMTLEELIASGITKFVSLGAAGALQESLNVGDIVVCERAIRDEGTSHHYVPDAKYATGCPELTAVLCSVMKQDGIPFRVGTTWTTDAPYRETVEELRLYRAEGVATVEMEASALFAVGAFRGVSVSSVFAVSDRLSEDGWHQAYHGDEKADALKKVFEAAIRVLALDGACTVVELPVRAKGAS
jgi:uridine phosphorylase